jgi:uncharacterized damage-inducible protein DinB
MAASGIDVLPIWARFNNDLIKLVDYVPPDKINWSPKSELWNFRGILLHIAATRDGWLDGATQSAEPHDDVWRTVRTPDQIKDAYRRTWERVQKFASDPAALDRTYDDEEGPVSGHWIMFHLLEHDIHHRADIFHYLALLDIKTPDVGTP